MDYTEIIEELFEAIDAIVTERIKTIGFDKTIVATIVDAQEAEYGRYKVSTDSNIIFEAFSERTKYMIDDKVYVRIPENDYTKLKIITGYYIPDNLSTKILNFIGEKGD